MESKEIQWNIIKGQPKEKGTYLVTVEDADKKRSVTIAKFDGNSFSHPYKVIAWANDPLPYEGEISDG